MKGIARTNAATALPSYVGVREELAAAPVLDRLWSAPWEEVRTLCLIPGSSLGTDTWEVPAEWVPSGPAQRAGRRTIDFRRALPTSWKRAADRSEEVIRRLKRMAAIIFCIPIRNPKRNQSPPKPTSWVRFCQELIRAARWVLDNEPGNGPAIFSHVTRAACARLLEAIPHFRKHVAPKLRDLQVMGAIDDFFNYTVEVGQENSRKGAPLPTRTQDDPEPYLPFPDEFTSVMGGAAHWLAAEVGDDLLTCWSHLQGIVGQPAAGMNTKDATRAARVKALQSWGGRRLQAGKDLPYALSIRSARGKDGGAEMLTSWPPSSPGGVRTLLARLQTAHMIMVSLSTGMRDSELMDLERECLRPVRSENLLVGHTFKLSDESDGEERDWPLPKIVVEAIRRQQRLAEIFAPGKDYLWVSFRDADESGVHPKLNSMSYPLKTFCDEVELDSRMLSQFLDGSCHPHRFRKTAVRLAALTLAGATSILYDILGHRDPEMTVNYILSDPQLQDEMRRIAREAVLVLAREAVENADGNGGAAAGGVKELRDRLAARSGPSDLGIGALVEAARILSHDGGQVALVRRNVLCTKTPTQRGPCTRGRGIPDVAACESDCLHRLELAAARADCQGAINRILRELETVMDPLVRRWWIGQLKMQLNRFDDIRQSHLADPRIGMLLEEGAEDEA
jgi:integrase